MEKKQILVGERNELHGCCGADVVYELSVHDVGASYDGYLAYTPYNDIDLTDSPGLMLATTVPAQKAETAKLLELGFKPVLSWTNRNTKNRITLFALGKFSLPTTTTKRAETTARRRSTKVGSKRSNGATV